MAEIVLTLPTLHSGQVKAFEVQRRNRFFALRCGRRWGKALSLDTPIPTPGGWTTMGQIVEGDEVFDDHGKICRVVGTTDVMLGRPCNRVVFSDGSEIVADDDHQWLTWTHCARKNAARNGRKIAAGAKKPIANAAPKVRTTAEIAATLTTGGRGDRNHSIPCAGAINLPDMEFTIHPYVLGAWLGDGSSACAGFTCHGDDVQIIEEIRACGEHVTKDRNDPIAWRLSVGQSGYSHTGAFISRARSLGVLNNKHIPAQYLRASAMQRLALLQGLMDTDGTTNNGRCEFCSTSKRLAFGVLELALSLGIRAVLFEGRASLNGKDCGAKYRVKFTTSRPVFRLLRKLEGIKARKARFNVEHRMIDAVIPVESVPVRCIAVDSESRLYLAGKSFIPTHNTEFLAALLADAAINGQLAGLFAPDYKRLSETYLKILEILRPILRSSSQTAGVIRTINGGVVECWTLADESAGRSRKYHIVGIDEAAFAKSAGKTSVMDIWRRSIKPTLLDYRGRAVAASNTSGEDPENFFWQITNQAEHGFVEYHSPSSENPYLPLDDIEALRKSEHPLVFAQEYGAEWVNWSGLAFFSLDSMLVDGAPPPMPKRVDAVLAIIDTAVKTGSGNDGTGIVYVGLNRLGDGPPLTILDWDIQQIEGDLLITWLPSVFMRLEDLAKQCRAMSGSIGAWIEDAQSGAILLQAAKRRDMEVHAIESALTSKGKDERALAASGYFFRGDVKICQEAFDKTTTYKGTTRNHLIGQLCGFRLNDKDAAKRADDLLDCAVYAPLITLGNSSGF